MQWHMDIGYFPNFSVKHLKVIKANALTLFSIHYFKLFFISFLSFRFYYTIIKFIMKVMFSSVLTFFFFETCFLFKDIFRRYFSFVFGIYVVYLLYHIRLIRLSGDIELYPGPKPSSFKYFLIFIGI